jgi:hypothetical protein
MPQDIVISPEELDRMKDRYGHTADLREDKTPVYSHYGQYGKPVTGVYVEKPTKLYEPGIHLSENEKSDPNERADVLKHEMVHHILRNADVPYAQDYQDENNFQRYKQPYQFLRDLGNYPFTSAKDQEPNPANYWDWKTSGRGGSGEHELPAYMAAGSENSWLAKVSPEARQLYLKNLDQWLRKKNANPQADRMQKLIRDRKTYNELGP